MEGKQKYGRTAYDIEGYGSISVLPEHQILDCTDRLFLTIKSPSKFTLSGHPWTPCIGSREIFEVQIMKLKASNEFLLKVMARSLNLRRITFYISKAKVKERQ
ncbi:unnamed protein product [Fraxinus pennsylvanica]|uniref:Uncharacterized protein n=1 Tax=Fraxinus pennsylvanica TaxID=56036 RepID=A0AAD2E866_9LAMI|nr:unnamed protein product [Fraxinus pennsylvanica]